MIRTWIVDDDAGSRVAAETALSAYEDVIVTGRFSGGAALFEALQNDRADLLILDIELGEELGFHLARELKECCPDLLIIFLTGHASYAIDGYGFHPVDFLTKPIRQSRLDEAMEEVRRRLTHQGTPRADVQIVLRSLNGSRIVDVSQLLFLERRSRRIYMTTTEGEERIGNYTMRELEEMLEPHDFFLCYQSVLVSLRHITGVIDVGKGLYELSLKGTAVKVPLSRNRHDELLRRLHEMG